MALAPLLYHQYILRKLLIKLYDFIDKRDLGELYFSPTEVVLSDTHVVQPDLLFVSSQRRNLIVRENVRGAPDFVVEILTPATAERVPTDKLELYARHDVQDYRLVDPDPKKKVVLVQGEIGFEVACINGEGKVLRSLSMEGFSVALEEILAGVGYVRFLYATV
jgi:Uma2 family endonuclease